MSEELPVSRVAPPNRILMGPGPSDVSSRVLTGMAEPTIGHLDKYFLQVMNETMDMIRQAYQTKNRLTVPISGTGSAGMDTVFVNMLEPGDKVVVGVKGLFGERMADVAGRCGAKVIEVEAPWGQPIDPQDIKGALDKNPDTKMVAIVHAETSTGVRQPLKEIADMAHDSGAIMLADMVTSLGGIPTETDKNGVDIAYSGTQKCLSCPPGLAPVTLGPKAEEILNNRKSKVQSWYLDMTMLASYWGKERFYHHTAPINMVYALHEALRIVFEEGLEKRFARHARLGSALQAGVEAMGLELLVEEEYRLPQLTAIRVPAGVDDAKVRGKLLDEYNIEIGGGLGVLKGKLWRVGLMGTACTWRNAVTFLAALEEILTAENPGAINKGAAIEAARKAYAAE